MDIVALGPLIVVTICVVILGAKLRRIPWVSIWVYVLILSATFIFNSFMMRHWALNLFVFCPLAFALAWLGVLIDMRRRK